MDIEAFRKRRAETPPKTFEVKLPDVDEPFIMLEPPAVFLTDILNEVNGWEDERVKDRSLVAYVALRRSEIFPAIIPRYAVDPPISVDGREGTVPLDTLTEGEKWDMLVELMARAMPDKGARRAKSFREDGGGADTGEVLPAEGAPGE